MSFTSTYNAVTVTTNPTLILASNNERKGSVITNASNQTVYLGMDSTLTISKGIPLLPNTSFNNSGQNAVWKGAVYGIVSATTADCRYWEYGQ